MIFQVSREAIFDTPPKSVILSPKNSKKNFESSSPSTLLPPSHSSSEIVLPKTASSNTRPSSTSPTEVLELPSNNNHDKDTGSFPYLKFDLALPAEQLILHMEEGVNIPGPAKPILVRAPKLPPGWTKEVSVRANVLTSGKWEVTIVCPEGKSFRSKQVIKI